jgi:hypothetical protein
MTAHKQAEGVVRLIEHDFVAPSAGPQTHCMFDWGRCGQPPSAHRAEPAEGVAGESAEHEIVRLRAALAEAAAEINCAGPVAHRIRVLKTEHAAALAAARAEGAREALEQAAQWHDKQAAQFKAEAARLEDLQGYGFMVSWHSEQKACHERSAKEIRVLLPGDKPAEGR